VGRGAILAPAGLGLAAKRSRRSKGSGRNGRIGTGGEADAESDKSGARFTKFGFNNKERRQRDGYICGLWWCASRRTAQSRQTRLRKYGLLLKVKLPNATWSVAAEN
jgi:hypothetical protein